MSKEMKRCPYCGEEILAVAIKCKHCQTMLGGNSVAEPQTEQILADVAVVLSRGIEGVTGRLKVTNRRLFFEATALNFQNMPAEIPLNDILEVGKRSRMGIVPNGMFIRTKAGVEYKFVVWGREKLIAIIESAVRDQRTK
jgi:hypothetical protein